MFRLLARICVRRRFGRCGFRLVYVQPFHHNVIGQMVFVTGIDGHRLGMERRCLGGFFNGLGGFHRRFGLLLPKAVQLAGIQPAQQRRDLIPVKIQHGQPLLLRVQHFQFDAFGYRAIVSCVASLQVHRLDDVGVGPAQPLGNLGVGLAGAQQLRKLRLIRRTDQAVGQHITQVLVCGVRVDGQKLGNGLVAGILAQQRLKPLFTFGPEDGIGHAGGQQLHRVLPQFGDTILLIFQIDRIAHMVKGRRGVIGGGGLRFRDSLLNGLIFLVRNGNVRLMGGFTAADGERVALAGDGLAGQVRYRRLCLGQFLGCDDLHIPHHLLDERVIVQLFRVYHLAVHDAALGQGFPDGNGVDVVKAVLLRFGIEPIFLDELRDPALHLGPGHIACRAVHCHRQGREVIAILLPQPGGGVLFTGVILHIADNRVLALDIAVPFLDGGVDLRLG